METRKAKTRMVSMVVLCVCGILACTLIATGGSLEPIAAPGPTMKTLDEVEPRIPIQSLPGDPSAEYVINQSGSYYLTGDITVTSTTKHGIQVDVDDVTIDLMGYSLIGPGSGNMSGIYMYLRTNVEIRNGTVRDFGSVGIHEANTNGLGHRVIGVRVVSNGSTGIGLYGDNNLIRDCTAAKNGSNGIYAGDGSTVTGNTTYNNQGRGINTGLGCTVTGNMVHGNQNHGIYVGKGCTVTGNTAYNNQNTGIVAGTGCTVTGNTAYFNKNYGIYPGGSCLVDQNTAYNNDQSGGGHPGIQPITSNVYGTNYPDIHP